MSFQVIATKPSSICRTHDRPVDLKDALKRSVKERPHAGEDKPAQRTARGRQR
jgi:non-homologous end joining protein Ku